MKKKSTYPLKIVRALLAVMLFIPVLALFLDFADVLPDALCSILHLQLMPAILSGAGGLLVFFFLLTLLFGRIYCSVLCPAGILQDIFNRLACFGAKKKRGAMRFHYHKPANWLRYVILSVTALAAVFGYMELCLLLDPYSNFGRIATQLFRPVVIGLNNLISGILTAHGNYFLYTVSVDRSMTALVTAAIAFIIFAVMAFYRGRMFCNTICPVGSLLSIISRYSLFRFKIDSDTCNGCKACERSCKAEAIDSQHKTVDMSICVACFNCISSCSRGAIGFKQGKVGGNGGKLGVSRRSFIRTGVAVAGSVPFVALAQGENTTARKAPVTPPGSLNLERFKKFCTGCHLCVVHCPSHVLKPAGLDFGWGYLLKPHMSYDKSYCNYSCTVCGEICPTHAIKTITVEQKKVTQMGVAHFDRDKCVVKTDETDCGACVEHCPMQAVHMVPYKGILTIPKVEKELCIGCGACESICPVRPERAIVVIANTIHQTAELQPEEEMQKVELDNFGF